MKKYIDIESWERRDQFKLFNQMDYPHFNICADVDITNMYSYIKDKSFSFSRTMVYLTTKTANNIKEFKYRIQGDKVVEYDLVHPSFTLLTKQDVFSFCSVRYTDDFNEFIRGVEEKVEELTGEINVEDDPERDDAIFITSLPWIQFKSITHPIHMNPTDCIPRIAWGKYYRENEKIKLPLSIQVNHALMDGIHVGKYFSLLQQLLDNPKENIR